VAATNFATFGWLEPPISEEIRTVSKVAAKKNLSVVVLYFGSLKTP
jgi:hypothetical protein